jgi:hypothetical protein
MAASGTIKLSAFAPGAIKSSKFTTATLAALGTNKSSINSSKFAPGTGISSTFV